MNHNWVSLWNVHYLPMFSNTLCPRNIWVQHETHFLQSKPKVGSHLLEYDTVSLGGWLQAFWWNIDAQNESHVATRARLDILIVGSIYKTIFRDTQCLLCSHIYINLGTYFPLDSVYILCSFAKIQLIWKLTSQYDYDYMRGSQ